MGQGGWRGSGLGGGQPERAAARELGNIMFFWLVAQDMHPAWTPPPNPTIAILSQSQGFLERGLGGRGPPSPAPTPGSLLQTRIRPPLGLLLQLLALAFPLFQTVHICWPDPKARAGKLEARFCKRPLLLP